MAASQASSDPSASIISGEEIRRQPRNAPYKFLVPLVYAPVLPLIRIGLRKRPVLRDRLFTAVLGGAFLHGFYLVTDIYDAESKKLQGLCGSCWFAFWAVNCFLIGVSVLVESGFMVALLFQFGI